MTRPGADTRRGRSRRWTTVALVCSVALLGGALAGCASTPRAVLNVPGTYVADLWAPSLDRPSGGPDATVVMCLDEASAVFLETGPGSEGAVGIIELIWAGTTYTEFQPGGLGAVTMTTPVLQPGCGTLRFGVDCCHVDHYLAIRATKV